MRQTKRLFAAVLASIAVAAVTPASAAQAKQADRQNSTRLGTAEQSDATTTTDLNRESLQAAQAGKEPSRMKGSTHTRQTAQLSPGAKAKAIRRAIAIRRARAAKAKQTGNS